MSSPPTLHELREISDEYHLNISDYKLNYFLGSIERDLDDLKTLNEWENPLHDEMHKYGSRQFHRATPEENRHNAWYYKCDIKGGQSEESSPLLLNKKLAIKDNTFIGKLPMMCGSKILEGYISEYDATVVKSILNHGGTIVGKTTTENLCLSGASFNTTYGPVTNPWNPEYSAGGSSSGSAVVVATGEADMSLGGDQAGSIRIPASSCGLVGLKPTFGLVPYTGIINIVRALDHVGPITRNVMDSARLLTAIAGFDDGRDDRQPTYGFPSINYLSEVVVCVLLRVLNSLKLHVLIVSGAVSGVLSNNLPVKLYNGLKSQAHTLHDLGKQLILSSAYVKKHGGHTMYSSFAKAQTWIWFIGKAYDKVLKDFDVLLMPTLNKLPIKIPSTDTDINEIVEGSIKMTRNTAPFNITHHPAITLNAGYDGKTNLPIGLQLVGRLWDDATVLKAAKLVEETLMGLQKPFNFTN